MESETRTGFPEERRLLLAGGAAENGVAMGKATEADDYRMMPLGIVVEIVEGLAHAATDLIAQVAEAGYRPLLAGQVLGVLQTR